MKVGISTDNFVQLPLKDDFALQKCLQERNKDFWSQETFRPLPSLSIYNVTAPRSVQILVTQHSAAKSLCSEPPSLCRFEVSSTSGVAKGILLFDFEDNTKLSTRLK